MIGVPQVSLTLLNPAQGLGSQKVPQILTPSRVGLLDRTSDGIRMGPGMLLVRGILVCGEQLVKQECYIVHGIAGLDFLGNQPVRQDLCSVERRRASFSLSRGGTPSPTGQARIM